MMAARSLSDERALEQLLEELYRAHHCDFRGYARLALARSVRRAQDALGVGTIAELSARVAVDERARRVLVHALTTQVSDLFRDPGYFRALRERVLPELATYPSIRVWVAGCGAGEEAYSIAVLLREAGLLGRAHIHATDIDEASLERAARGAYAGERASDFCASYAAAGGRGKLTDHCTVADGALTFDRELRGHVTFVEHSLATDAVFAEVQLVSCRNVLIYFDRALRDRVLGTFLDALCPRGFLGLGAREHLLPSRHAAAFVAHVEGARIYRRSGWR
jgi:chemotaxis protein methyltransferase CheR